MNGNYFLFTLLILFFQTQIGAQSYDMILKESAQSIQREELGHLSVGAFAEVAVLNLCEGKFGFYDVVGSKVEGSQLLKCEMTIKDGKVLYDLKREIHG